MIMQIVLLLHIQRQSMCIGVVQFAVRNVEALQSRETKASNGPRADLHTFNVTRPLNAICKIPLRRDLLISRSGVSHVKFDALCHPLCGYARWRKGLGEYVVRINEPLSPQKPRRPCRWSPRVISRALQGICANPTRWRRTLTVDHGVITGFGAWRARARIRLQGNSNNVSVTQLSTGCAHQESFPQETCTSLKSLPDETVTTNTNASSVDIETNKIGRKPWPVALSFQTSNLKMILAKKIHTEQQAQNR